MDKPSILIVDDDRDFLGIITRILGKKGFDVVTAATAGEAVDRLVERFFNVAILDISLPDADGTELITRIMEINPDIIAVMLTGHSSVQSAIKSLNRGAFAYLEKPVDPDSLISVVNRGIERQSLILENRRLMEELEQHNRVTNTLLSVSQAVSRSLDLQEIINAALDTLSRSTGFEASFIYLYQNDQLVLQGFHGLSKTAAREIPGEIDNGHILNRIFELARPESVLELTGRPGMELEFLSCNGYRSFAGVPLTVLAESIGVMGVATSFEYDFTPANIDLLSRVGREIAIAVRNVQLYEEASSAKALRELDVMRNEFLANVSHELRTPLAVIKGSANSLLQPDVAFDEETRRDFLVSIDKDADTLTRLVDDLLMMSRLEADALEVTRKKKHIAEVVASVKDRLDSLAARHRLIIRIPENVPAVEIDEQRIGEVLTNLVENAAKFSDENTEIIISAKEFQKHVIVSVEDHGIGIPAEYHQKVFDRFFQGDNRLKGKRKGTGLGLAICRGIIEAHGGTIWIESEPGRGTRFNFSLPVN